MEPDNTADKAASLDFKSKIAFFNIQNKAQQSTQTNNASFRRGSAAPPPPTPPPVKLATTVCQTTPAEITRTELERAELESNVESKEEPKSESPSLPKSTRPPIIEQNTETGDKSNESDDELCAQTEEVTVRKNRHQFNDELCAKIEAVAARKISGWSPNDMEIFKRPMCLIGADKLNALTISTEVVSQLEMIDWPMVVISVVGLYRTGKSYLMNRLAESTTGFALGDTIESETKGIWAWCKIHPKMTNTVLLLLDTEGLGDVDKGDSNHDNKIFTLAALLCNCLVYNMKGAFDQDAVNKLTFVTEMASNIRYRGKSSEDNQMLNLILPDFVLCVRDFSLKLSKGGKKITEDEYLEQSLAEKEGKTEKFNKPRECIRKYFPQRKCFTLPVPGDGDTLENLETIRFDQLSEKFKEATIRFTTYIYGKKPKELVTSKPVNGLMFVTLANHYVTAIRHGAVPDVDDAFLAVAKIENTKIRKESIEIFESQMEKIVLPVSASHLEMYYTRAQQTSLNYLRKNVVHDKDGAVENNAQLNMDNIWNKLKEENVTKVKEMCETNLQEAYCKSLKRSIEEKVFEVAGGYKKFQRNMEILKEEYFSSLRDFEEHEVSWAWLGFINKTKNAESMIIQADEVMSQKEKEDEKKRNEERIQKVIKQQEKANKKALAHQKKEMDAHYQKINEDRLKQMEEDQQKFAELAQEKLARETAQKELASLKKEQDEKTKEMEAHSKKIIEDLHKRMEENQQALLAVTKDKETSERELAVVKKEKEEKDEQLEEISEDRDQLSRKEQEAQKTLNKVRKEKETSEKELAAIKQEKEEDKKKSAPARMLKALRNK